MLGGASVHVRIASPESAATAADRGTHVRRTAVVAVMIVLLMHASTVGTPRL